MLAKIYTALKIHDEPMLGMAYRKFTADIIDKYVNTFDVHDALVIMPHIYECMLFLRDMILKGWKYNVSAQELSKIIDGTERYIYVYLVPKSMQGNEEGILIGVIPMVTGREFQMTVFVELRHNL